MKQHDNAAYENAFGKAPASFRGRIAETLTELQAGEQAWRRGKSRVRMVLIAALVLMLVMGIAYAAARHFGIIDYYQALYDRTLPQSAQEALRFDAPLAEMTVGELDVTVTEAIADGHYLYMAAQLTPRMQGDVWLQGTEGYPWARETTDDTQRYRTRFVAEVGGVPIDITDFYPQDENGLVYILAGALPAEGTVEVVCTVSYFACDVTGAMLDDAEQTGTLTFTLPVTDALQTRTVAVDMPIEGLAASLTGVTLTRTPLTTYVSIEMAFDEDAPPEAIAQGRFLDAYLIDPETDFWYQQGTAVVRQAQSPDDIHYVFTDSYPFEEMPEEVYVRFVWYDALAEMPQEVWYPTLVVSLDAG